MTKNAEMQIAELVAGVASQYLCLSECDIQVHEIAHEAIKLGKEFSMAVKEVEKKYQVTK